MVCVTIIIMYCDHVFMHTISGLTIWAYSQNCPKNEPTQTHRWLVTFTVAHVPLLIHGDGRQGAV